MKNDELMEKNQDLRDTNEELEIDIKELKERELSKNEILFKQYLVNECTQKIKIAEEEHQRLMEENASLEEEHERLNEEYESLKERDFFPRPHLALAMKRRRGNDEEEASDEEDASDEEVTK
jgi:hypothetical protein